MALRIWLRTTIPNEKGQDLAEYAMLIALIAIVAAMAVGALGAEISNKLNAAVSLFTPAG